MSRAVGGDAPVVLLVSSNGAGMGHLTRLLAYGRRLGTGLRPHIVSLSQAVPVVAAYDVPWEYLPSAQATGMDSGEWRWLFAERMREAVLRLRPAVLVFDGTHPYSGLDDAVAASPGTRAVWSRRAMWKPRHNSHQLSKVEWFDAVLEPGDLAAAADRGATVGTDAHRVGPVTLLDPEECSDRAGARIALGLPPDGPLALVSLGAGNINDTSDEVGAAVSALGARGVGVCVTQPSIAEQAGSRGDVHLVRRFPISQHLAAFDVAVAAAGYNSFHEHLRFGLPTLFVPNDETSLDDQVTRAEHAAARGWALSVRTLTGPAGDAAVDALLDRGPSLAEAARAADPGNGAADAAALLGELAGVVR
ncbi:UDP-N-acetylglucosamine--LPS N-acetylglucosamine transferase [Phycicoccus sp. CSK15P-2]|uniref:glycosyltransferase n=1 Tax=Phycicoccus sp. CSK15P-2 TaxID=2807627 RepID=UPI00194E2858|nr:glycosyltransferase [Phycicoccus sp. CSK15P-2]MBM6402947.1 UDP-N-acetylglucosamine--LPS N-acetylglucosamine transferase [Phycicoccus sp. CSK15P-2]